LVELEQVALLVTNGSTAEGGLQRLHEQAHLGRSERRRRVDHIDAALNPREVLEDANESAFFEIAGHEVAGQVGDPEAGEGGVADRVGVAEEEAAVDGDRARAAGAIGVTSGSMQLELALAGVGAVVYSERFCAEEVKAGRLVHLLPGWSTAPVPLWLVTPSRRLLPRKTVLFIEHLVSTIDGGPRA
jgi:DNA-binding transcriptional LysR family regulator